MDSDYETWLIEVNTNPCLDTTSSLLARIIPGMLENSFRFIKILELENLLSKPFNGP